MRRWTFEERLKQAQLIRIQMPWRWSSGAKTLQGKAKCKMNAIKAGLHNKEMRGVARYIAENNRLLRQIRNGG